MMDRKEQIQGMMTQAAAIADPSERSVKYRNIVIILITEAVRSGDTRDLDEAIKIAGLVTEDASKSYVEIIRAMVKLSIKRNDEKMLHEAVRLAEDIDNPLDLSVALHEVAVAFAKFNLDYAITLTERIPKDTLRSSAFRNISRQLAGSNPVKAKELLEISIGILEKSNAESAFLASAYCGIAYLLAKLGDERSSDFIKRAVTLTTTIKDDFERSAVLLRIVETKIALASEKHDDRFLKEVADLSESITQEYYRTLAFNAIKNSGFERNQ